MKSKMIVIAVILLVGCKSKDQKLREQIEPILKTIAVQDSFVNKLDSIKIYKIYNLSDLEYAKRREINLLDKSDLYVKISKSFSEEGQLKEQSMKLSLSQERLYAYLGSSLLVQTEKESIVRDGEELKKLITKAQLYNDSAKFFLDQQGIIRKKIESHKIDSTNFKGYVVLYRILGSDKRNMEVKRDSIKTYLSPNFRIIPINKI